MPLGRHAAKCKYCGINGAKAQLCHSAPKPVLNLHCYHKQNITLAWKWAEQGQMVKSIRQIPATGRASPLRELLAFTASHGCKRTRGMWPSKY